MSKQERMELIQAEHEERKRERVDKLVEVQQVEAAVAHSRDKEFFKKEKAKKAATIEVLKSDVSSQKDQIMKRIAERKQRQQLRRSGLLESGDD